MGIESALEAWKAGYKDGYHFNGVHDDEYPNDADDYQNGWMEGEADRINSDPALLAADVLSQAALVDAANEAVALGNE